MSTQIDGTHDASLQSWLASANDPASDFPIQNLPFGRFRLSDDRRDRKSTRLNSSHQ